MRGTDGVQGACAVGSVCGVGDVHDVKNVAWKGPECVEGGAERGAPMGCEVPTECVASTVHEILKVFGITVLRGVAMVHWMVAGGVGCS